MAFKGFLGNACRPFATIFQQEENQEDSGVLLASMQQVIKGLLCQDVSVQHYHTVYHLSKNE